MALGLTIGAVFLTARGIRLSTESHCDSPSCLQVMVMVAVCWWSWSTSVQPFPVSFFRGALDRRPGRVVSRVSTRPLHVHRLGERSGPRGRVSEPEAGGPEGALHLVAIAARLLRPVWVLHHHRLPLRRLLDRTLVGPFLSVADPIWRSGGARLAGRDRLGARDADGGSQLAVPDALRRRTVETSARPGSGSARPCGHPVNALVTMSGRAGNRRDLVALHVVVAPTVRRPVGLYAEASTMGTIVILFVYLLTTIALPVFMWRHHRDSFSTLRHLAVPVLGALDPRHPIRRAVQAGTTGSLPCSFPSSRGYPGRGHLARLDHGAPQPDRRVG